MGYWRTTQAGESLQLDETGLIWGDQPADMIDDGMERLIARLYLEKHRLPTVGELDALKFGADKPAELVFAIKEASRVFTEDVDREPLAEEILAGLNFSTSEVALDAFVRRHGDQMAGNPLRGMVYGVLWSLPIWILIGLAIWWISYH